MNIAVVGMIFLFLGQNSFATNFEWKVSNDWNKQYENKFSDFVARMGDSTCRSLKECLTKSTSNPFYINKTPDADYFADCADFPFALRMYFAWMEGLPFDYVNYPVQAKPEAESNQDIRYSKHGNKPGKIRKFEKGKIYDANHALKQMRSTVSTATYRMHFEHKSDFYPVAVNSTNIRPGTVVYDPSGHAAIVYKIEKDGRVRMMDAHPDNSVTRITFDKKFTLSRAEHGAGFKNWRPELNESATNNLQGYSEVQFQKTFAVSGQKVDFYEYVRLMLAGQNLRYKPVQELKNMILEICSNISDRVIAVNTAIQSGIQKQPHPDKLPQNIYGTTGEWEEYASPSRDARLKVAFVELRETIEKYIDMYAQGSKKIEHKSSPEAHTYSNCDYGDRACLLAYDLLNVYSNVIQSNSCQFSYTNSEGDEVSFGYEDVLDRLFKISFDPYHCVELRWGAYDYRELRSCSDSNYKKSWYQAQQNLRNQTERTYDQKMDYDINGTRKYLGVKNPPDIDLLGYLQYRARE